MKVFPKLFLLQVHTQIRTFFEFLHGPFDLLVDDEVSAGVRVSTNSGGTSEKFALGSCADLLSKSKGHEQDTEI